MTDTFRSRIPTLSDAELRQYVAHPLDYRTEAVEAALEELARRGLAISREESTRVREQLGQRDATTQANQGSSRGGLLGRTPETRRSRVRLIAGGILAAGLGSAALIYLKALPNGPNPLGYEPEDTKKYLRDLELYGGKVNVLATEFMRWWDGLWHGRQLAFTVAWLTLIVAAAFWLVATRHGRDLGAD